MVAEKLHIDTQHIVREKFTLDVIDNEIISVMYHDNVVIEAADFQEAISLIVALTQGAPYKVISDMGKYVTVSTEGRKFAESLEIGAIAEAVVIHGLPQRLLIKFYYFIRKQQHPFKVVQSKEAALAWLKSIEYSKKSI